ncbi:MAG TPA: hypothetical protein VM935_01470 [Chitinophagaceae bacterium]|jgi:hypothetical protein|nr:hypothetical protein [Chitinophagaceae bacterium]
MHSTLLTLHSLFRWLVLISLACSIYRSYNGFIKNKIFSKTDNAFRHWTATVAHIQLVIGITLYTKSPIVTYFWADAKSNVHNTELTFYGVIHIALMIGAITILTIGSALTKRKATDREQFRTMLTWFSVALLIILLAIPWPFSPLSGRPYFRSF